MRLATLTALLGACSFSLPQEIEEPGFELVWEEEFRGDAGDAPDPDTWTYDVGAGGWGNNELQYYTEGTENVSLNGDGFLVIEARREEREGAPWTSARLRTQGLQEFQYGRIDIRALAPRDRGVWPALWMLGNDFDDVGWPLCGEIDIMEVFGERSIGVAVHGPNYNGAGAISETWDGAQDDFASTFHVYSVIWDPQSIVWMIDDEIVNVIDPSDLPAGSPWVFDHPFFFILNVAMGGNTVQAPNDTTPDVNRLVVDYIKVFERVPPIDDGMPDTTEEEETETATATATEE